MVSEFPYVWFVLFTHSCNFVLKRLFGNQLILHIIVTVLFCLKLCRIVFKFKNSKKSNNGTDTNAGQIPQLFYRLPTADSSNSCMTSSGGRKAVDYLDPVHVLSLGFSRTISPVRISC